MAPNSALIIREAIAHNQSEIAVRQQAIKSLQAKCKHKTSVYSCHGSTGNWDRDDSYWYMHYCYDCQKRWSLDQQGNRPQATLQVKDINYDEKPEVVELQIRIAEIK